MIPFIAWHPIYVHPLPEGHRFPMMKYELLREQLLHEGVVNANAFLSPEPVEESIVTMTHDPEYVKRLKQLSLSKSEIRRIGFPLSSQLVKRELHIVEGTFMASEAARETGIGFNIAGGTHHAGSDWGEGFCLLNDQAIAAQYLLDHAGMQHILIIDLDVHQGNGTAEIFQNESRVFTFSMHGQNNFPFQKEVSDLDVGLPDDIQGKAYLEMLEHHLSHLFKENVPQFVFYQSGVDVLATDQMGKLNLTIEDCKMRDRMVFEFCRKHHVPVQVSMGGGYSGSLRDIVDAHCHTYKEGVRIMMR